MNRRLTIALHLLVWGLIIGQETNIFLRYHADMYVSAIGLSKPIYFSIVSTLYLIDSAILFYGIAFLTCPLFFKHKKYFKGGISFIGLLAVIVLYRYFIEFHILKPYLRFDNYFGKKVSFVWYIKNCLLYNFTTSRYALYGIIYFFVSGWYHRSRKLKELSHQKTEAELSFLRNQVNPHFLFNTINDIYTLSVKNRAETSSALLRLSSMLRYLLTDNDTNLVSLDKEIDYIRDYIELQRISYQNTLCIDFNTEGRIEEWRIPRLLLVPFIENAFKHGEITSPNNLLNICLKADKNNLSFVCHNKVKTMLKDKTSGIGLNNVKRRLSLIYPGQHKLLILNKNGKFLVKLNIYNRL